ncbi:Imm26 family immunity protein [Pedobacter nototheniae]|uniref:Imm26 family immunity protein n=1 Tax=Pedobacter nototheniae TaxID=2488994 RepID=UPI0013F42EB3|nr:Imm26 family immunity protein [Pedobacter nototheniae]
MSRKKFKNGDILQIPLPNGLGFAYAKGINLLELNNAIHYPTMIRVYNFRTTSVDIPLTELLNKKLVLCPLLIAGILPTLSKGVWKIIGNTGYSEEEKEIPNYKIPEPDEENLKDWYYVVNADISQKIKSTYDNVKHLETIGAKGAELVGTKIAMALIRDEGKNIEDYFKLEEYFEKKYYQEVIEIPTYYKQSQSIKGKAIT